MGMTLENLLEKEETKNQLVSEINTRLNQLETQRTEKERERKAASSSGKIDEAIQAMEAIKELDALKAIYLESLDDMTGKHFFTDDDCIEAANNAITGLVDSAAKEKLNYYKWAEKLCESASNLAKIYMEAQQKKNQCLIYHSAYPNESAMNNMSDQGLEEMPTCPDVSKIFGLLFDKYGDEAYSIRAALCLGAIEQWKV